MSRARLVRANNPSPMTLDGTNTWVLKETEASRAIVVDPGPADAEHFQATLDVAGGVGLILLTHGHPDHAEAPTILPSWPTRPSARWRNRYVVRQIRCVTTRGSS